jgi:heme/copper-type cytochrome/quinol oxidase subunit 4
MRTLIAFFGAPVIPAIIAAWVVHLNHTYTPLNMFVFICLVFYALQVVIGVPAYMFMSRKNLHRAWIYLLLSCFSVALPLLLLFIWRHTEKGYGLAEYVLLCYPALLGAVTGIMFWVLARPDKRGNAAPQSN